MSLWLFNIFIKRSVKEVSVAILRNGEGMSFEISQLLFVYDAARTDESRNELERLMDESDSLGRGEGKEEEQKLWEEENSCLF